MKIRSLFGAISILSGIGLGGAVFAQQPPIIVNAEWIGAPCQAPASFRITLTNPSSEKYWVPKGDTLGHGRTVNLVSWHDGLEETTEIYFGPPPLTARPEARFFVELAPGESHAFDVAFDGMFTPHGGPARGPTGWGRDVQFEYTLAAPDMFGAVAEFGSIRVRDPEIPVRSNVLRCPES